ncbi:MAG: rhombosortase, partial [Gammaproteobacteria bacterium]|nr:rhombosortase [Gammaproteobacteria bacterium]
HTGSIHVLLNVSGIFVLWLLHGDYYRTLSYLGAALFTGVGTTLGLLLFAPDVFWYMGLSGLLHGIFVWGVARDFQAGKPTAWILAAGLVLKLVWEHFYGGDSSIEQLITAPIATEAHLYGSISGALLTGILLMYQGYLPDQLE